MTYKHMTIELRWDGEASEAPSCEEDILLALQSRWPAANLSLVHRIGGPMVRLIEIGHGVHLCIANSEADAKLPLPETSRFVEQPADGEEEPKKQPCPCLSMVCARCGKKGIVGIFHRDGDLRKGEELCHACMLRANGAGSEATPRTPPSPADAASAAP